MAEGFKIEPKVTFYVLPEELRTDKERSCSRDEAKQYQVTEEELYERFKDNRDICIQGYAKATYCWCGNPPKKKSGYCWDYHTQKGQYCYTRCESCYIICNRPAAEEEMEDSDTGGRPLAQDSNDGGRPRSS